MNIDKYKQECGGYKDEEDCWWEDAESFLAGKILGFCGCGNNEVALEYIRDVLTLIDNIYKTDKNPDDIFSYNKDAYDALDAFFGGNEGLQYTIYYLLDMKGLTEHGGSVPGWLTEKGKELLVDINELLAATVRGVSLADKDTRKDAE